MEAVSRGVRRYWRRNSGGYVRVYRATGHRIARAQLGSPGGSKRRSWRVKIRRPKLRLGRLRWNLSWSSPKRFLVWLRDAYVSMMLGVANSRAVTGGGHGFALGGTGAAGFGRPPLKEYDEKMILEIYKSLVLARSRQLAADGIGPLASTTTNVANKLAAISE